MNLQQKKTNISTYIKKHNELKENGNEGGTGCGNDFEKK